MAALDPSFIWIPTGQDYGGINDRHLVVNSENLEVIDIMASLILFPTRYTNVLRKPNPEGLLWYMLGEMGKQELVRRFAPMMFVAAKSGDRTRWSVPGFQVPDSGVGVKYVDEYELAVESCKTRGHT